MLNTLYTERFVEHVGIVTIRSTNSEGGTSYNLLFITGLIT